MTEKLKDLLDGLRERNCCYTVKPLEVSSYIYKVIEVTYPVRTIIRYDCKFDWFTNLTWGVADFLGGILNGNYKEILQDIDNLANLALLEANNE